MPVTESTHGILVLDKPPGPSSYDCIRLIRKYCGLSPKWKIGHLGTLDPFACGVLVIAFGKAVRYAEYALHSDKAYKARVYLGEETDTLDNTGKVIHQRDIPLDWIGRLPSVIAEFEGEIEQVPPSFSAKHVDGKRSYKSAREGDLIELDPVKVTIHEIGLDKIGENWFDFSCVVSSGTYIRSLGRDIARRLGTVGHLVGLERTSVANFSITIAIPLKALEIGGMDVLDHHIKKVEMLLEYLPAIMISHDGEAKIDYGKKIIDTDILEKGLNNFLEGNVVRIINESHDFLSLGRVGYDGGIIPFKPWSTIG